MLALDIILRFSAFGLLASMMMLAWRDQRRSLTGQLLVALCLTLMALMVSSAPPAIGLSTHTKWVIRFFDLPNTVLAWLFVKSIMNDDFRLDALHIGLSLIYCLTVWFLTLNIRFDWVEFDGLLAMAVNVYALGLFIYLIVDVLLKRKDDLIEPRRRWRLVFVGAVLVLVSVMIAAELILVNVDNRILSTLKVTITFLLVLFGHYWFLSITEPHIAFDETSSKPSPLGMTDKETWQLMALKTAMEVEEVWRAADLSLERLAAHIAISPKRLRYLIHSHLGYRNFRHYLQAHRVEAAKHALIDPKLRDVTILEIALDAGFNSTSTFNRVFKQTAGLSPKAYRQKR